MFPFPTPLLVVSLTHILFICTDNFIYSFHSHTILPSDCIPSTISGLEQNTTFASSSNGYVSGKPDAEKKKNLCSHSLVVDYETTMFRNNFQLYKISSAHVISPYLCLKAHLYSTTLFFHPNIKKTNLERKKNEENE